MISYEKFVKYAEDVIGVGDMLSHVRYKCQMCDEDVTGFKRAHHYELHCPLCGGSYDVRLDAARGGMKVIGPMGNLEYDTK